MHYIKLTTNLRVPAGHPGIIKTILNINNEYRERAHCPRRIVVSLRKRMQSKSCINSQARLRSGLSNKCFCLRKEKKKYGATLILNLRLNSKRRYPINSSVVGTNCLRFLCLFISKLKTYGLVTHHVFNLSKTKVKKNKSSLLNRSSIR